jgi:hypothetical protein
MGIDLAVCSPRAVRALAVGRFAASLFEHVPKWSKLPVALQTVGLRSKAGECEGSELMEISQGIDSACMTRGNACIVAVADERGRT